MVRERSAFQISLFCILLISSISQNTLAESFTFGVINERPDYPDHAIKQFNLFLSYLQEQLSQQGIDVTDLVIANSIDELVSLVDTGQVDAFLEGVMPVIKIQQATPIDIGLLTWRKQQREYYSVFFVRQDSNIKDLSALGGKDIIFESPRSTSAYLVPKLTLQSMGYTLSQANSADSTHSNQSPSSKHIKYRFSETENNQAYWVHKKIGDIGAFNNGDWERIPQVIRKDLKIVGQSKPILRWLLAYRKDVSDSIRQKVNTVLLAMHESPEGRKALNNAERILKFEHLNQQDLENYMYWQNRTKEVNND